MPLYLQDPYYFSTAIAVLVIALQVAAVFTILLMLFASPSSNKYLAFLAQHAIGLAFTVVVVAVTSSMTYSDIFHMNPCKLCWYQRIFIFPQVILLGMALLKKHTNIITDYSLVFACIAAPISVFHYLLQITDAPAVHAFAPCDVTGQAPSCSGFYVHMYGYVTIPLMALTTSLVIALLMVLRKRAVIS